MIIRRKEFLAGVGGSIAGAAAGVLGDRWIFGREAGAVARPIIVNSARRAGVVSLNETFAQSGEDVIVRFAAHYLGVPEVTYLDIGAFHPININNTYLFYLIGHRGVLVEPNVAMCAELRRVRPEDTTLEAGIGVSNVSEADYYVMTDPSWNTFSKEEAEHQEEVSNKRIKISEVIKMPLLNINDVMEKHFGEAPGFISIDAEGLHQAIVESIDFDRFRPKFICVETLISGTKDTIPAIPSFLATKGYTPRGGSFVNTIFVDSNLLSHQT